MSPNKKLLLQHIVRSLPLLLLLFVGAQGCRPGSQSGGESSADMPMVERSEASSGLKGLPDAEVGEIEAARGSAAGAPELLVREYVPPDALFVSVVFPRRILARPELANAPIERVLQKISFLDRAPEMPVPARFLMELGIPLEDVEQVICVVTGFRTASYAQSGVSQSAPGAETGKPAEVVVGPDGEAAATDAFETVEVPYAAEGPGAVITEEQSEEPGREFVEDEFEKEHTYTSLEQDPWLYGPLMEAYVVRLTGPAPRAAVDLLFRPGKVTVGKKTYFGQGKETGALAVHFADERTMIVGEERVVRTMLAEERARTALSEALADLDLESDIVGVVNVAAVREQVMPRTKAEPAANAPTDDAGVATFSVRLDPRPSTKVAVRVKDAEAGERVKEVLRGAITAARRQVEAMPPRQAPPEVAELRELAQDLFNRGVDALQFERVEDRVEVTLADFAALGDLATLLSRFDTAALGRVDVPLPAVSLSEGDFAAAAIRRLIPAAAGCRAEILGAIARSSATPKVSDVARDVALSMTVWTYKIVPPDMYPGHAEEFRFLTQDYPKPSELAGELLRSRHLGYYSVIQEDRITDFTCQVADETAKGSVSFNVPNLYEGKVEYVAERAEGRWRIKEFHLPNHRWQLARTEAGQWKWFTMFGDIGEQLSPSRHTAPHWPGQPVSGKITLDGKPLPRGLLQFFHTVDVQFPGIGFVRNGTYSAELPAGSYHVVIASSPPEVPQGYRELGQSGLMIEVKEGENTFDFELASE